MDRKNQPRRAVRVSRPLTSAETARLRELHAEAERDKSQILAEAERVRSAKRQATAKLREAFLLLKSERQRQGLSLADITEQTGIGRGALSRLETDLESNPTVETLERYAKALGRTLVIGFA